ncbi:MAG: hypothetical protein RLY20_2438, partial [Verrucomicrobiota bacterium]
MKRALFQPVLLLVALMVAFHVAMAQTNNETSRVVTNIGRSPVQVFRELLSVSDSEREEMLNLRPPGMREPIEAKVKEYLALPANERELRLQATELRYYLTLLLPMTNWSKVVTQIAEPMQTVVRDRLAQWQVMPPDMCTNLIENERVVSYFSQLGTLTSAQRKALLEALPSAQRTQLEADIQAWQAKPEAERRQAFLQFKQFFTFNAEEQKKALSHLSEAERDAMQTTLETFAELSEEKRQICIRSFEKFANMSLGERQEFLKKADAWRRMTPAERAEWQKVVRAVPDLPPLPPGFDASINVGEKPVKVNKIVPPGSKA